MKKAIFALLMGASIVMVSCGGSETTNEPTLVTTTVTSDDPVATTGANWEFDSVTMYCYGYKLEAKTQVKLWFDNVEVKNFNPSPDYAAAITGVTFDVHTPTVASGDSTRDFKLATFLFETMETPVITGEIKSVADGKATVAVTMGGTTNDIEMSCKLNDNNEVEMVGTISSLPAWSELAKAGFDALSEACSEKHEGVTHEDVEIRVWASLSRAAE